MHRIKAPVFMAADSMFLSSRVRVFPCHALKSNACLAQLHGGVLLLQSEGERHHEPIQQSENFLFFRGNSFCHNSGQQAKAGGIWVWGYDEITWFAHQSKPFRAQWLRYAWEWVRRTDPNGHLQMPGSRTMRSPLDNKRWYYANTPSPSGTEGLGDEEAICAIWAEDSPPTNR